MFCTIFHSDCSVTVPSYSKGPLVEVARRTLYRIFIKKGCRILVLNVEYAPFFPYCVRLNR